MDIREIIQIATVITDDPDLFLEHADLAAAARVVQEFDLLHHQAGLPLANRVYWPSPDVMERTGYIYPAWVRGRGYDTRCAKGQIRLPPDRDIRTAVVGRDNLGLVEYSDGIAITGLDENGRRCYVAVLPTRELQRYLPRIEALIGVTQPI